MKHRRSFTLVEILAAVGIIAILAGMALGVTSYVRNKNREVQTTATIRILEMALGQHRAKFGNYPSFQDPPSFPSYFKLPQDHKLIALLDDVQYNGSDVTGIKGLNIRKDGSDIIVLDGWGSPLVYVYPGVFNRTKFDLGSVGPDKLFGDDSGGMLDSSWGTRTSGAYKSHFGKADDITNFKRADNN